MRSAFGFGWRFAVAYCVAAVLWVGVLERGYNDSLAWVCRHLLVVLEAPRLTTSVERHQEALVIEHISQFDNVPTQEIVTRRVHSNTPLFVALTLATPGVGWLTRTLWLVVGSIALSLSHTAHALAYSQHHYALYNVGPYFTDVPVEELGTLGLRALWARPAALRRGAALAVADLFNIVLQRLVPVLLWLPLLLNHLLPRDTGAAVRPVRRLRRSLVVTAGVLAMLGAASLATRSGTRAPVADTIAGVRLGMGALAARRGLEKQGYDWTDSVRPIRLSQGLVTGYADVWPRTRPLANQGWSGRYNWIGLEIVQPPTGATSVLSACITAIETAPSDRRPERYRLAAAEPLLACGGYWESLEPGD